MHRSQKMEAFVLSRRNIGEADRLVTLFTREQGIVRAIAKGVRKVPSSRGGHLEPFTQVLALVRVSRAGTYLEGVETKEYFSALKSRPNVLVHAQAMVHLIVSVLGEEDAHPRVYDALEEALLTLPNISEAKQDILEGSVLLLTLREAGLMPSWQRCGQCRTERPTDAVVLDAAGGGFRCLSCHTSLAGTEFSLAPDGLKVLRYISQHPEQALRLSVHQSVAHQMLSSLRWYVGVVLRQTNLSRV